MSSIWTGLMGVEYSQKYYDVKGIKTRVIEAGSGPVLIFLHGTGGHATLEILKNTPSTFMFMPST